MAAILALPWQAILTLWGTAVSEPTAIDRKTFESLKYELLTAFKEAVKKIQIKGNNLEIVFKEKEDLDYFLENFLVSWVTLGGIKIFTYKSLSEEIDKGNVKVSRSLFGKGYKIKIFKPKYSCNALAIKFKWVSHPVIEIALPVQDKPITPKYI